jgi:hypothetical protein
MAWWLMTTGLAIGRSLFTFEYDTILAFAAGIAYVTVVLVVAALRYRSKTTGPASLIVDH